MAKLGRDAILSESLDAASRGSGEYAVIHRTIGDRFRTLIPDFATGGIDEIVALDNKGRVIARVGGDNEKEYGDFIGGVEVVADALRGYLSDDAWGVGGKLERVAGAPVLSKSKDWIVGAVYVAAETGPSLVERLKKNLDVDTALLLRGKVVAASRAASELDGLPELVAQHTGEIAELKRTPALPLTVGSETLLAVAAPVPRPGGRAAGLLRGAGRAAAGQDRFVGAAIAVEQRELQRSQVGELPLDPAQHRDVRDDRRRPPPAAAGGRGPGRATCAASCRSWRPATSTRSTTTSTAASTAASRAT